MTDELRSEPAAAEAPRSRLLSLDVLRGLTVFGMIVVNSAAGMESKARVFPTLLHSHWDGLTLADLVFPGFLMMLGVSIPLSLGAARDRYGLDSLQTRRILGRTFRLVLLGFILSNLWWFSDFSATSWRLFGVLQRIGLAYGACALLFLLCGPKLRAAILVAILLLYWPLALLPSLDGLSTDLWLRGHNFIGSVDRVLLGAGNHNYVTGPEGYDPEGLLGTLPAIAHGLIGVAVGEFLLARRMRGAALPLGLAGLAMLVVGIAWGFVFPVVKDIWSSSFVLVTCGITAMVLALLHAWLDRPDAPTAPRRLLLRLALPFGVNAIAAYVLHMVTAGMVGWSLFQLPFEAARPLIGGSWASLLPVFLYAAFIWACVDLLRRRGWIFKI
jgi:predicted acyltransferase